jgi:PAS domain S-box-containing protein
VPHRVENRPKDTSSWAGNWLVRAVASGGWPSPLDRSATLGALFVAGAAVTAVLVSAPGIGTADEAMMLVTASVALAGGAALWRFRPPVGQGTVVVALVLGTTWMGADAFALSSGGVFLSLWFAPAAFALVAAAPAVIIALYAIAVPGIVFAATGELTARTGAAGAAKQWVIVAAVIVIASGAVFVLSRRTEDRDRTLASLSKELAVGIAVIGAGRRLLAVNPALRQMLGGDDGPIVGSQVESFTAPEHSSEVRRPLDALLSGSVRTSAFDLRIVRPDTGALDALVYGASVEPGRRGARLVVALVYDLSERRRIDERRAELASLLVSAQEDERRRIAGEVHDDPLQALIALSLELQILERRTTEESFRTAIGELRGSIKEAIEQLRGLLFELHPPGLELGDLGESIKELIRRYEASGGPKVTFDDALAKAPTPEEAVALFRITAEALTNVRKHANATTVSVSLADSQGGITLSVADDGAGIVGDTNAVVPGHLGVASMRARAAREGGSLEISSQPGRGTTVAAWIPRREG